MALGLTLVAIGLTLTQSFDAATKYTACATAQGSGDHATALAIVQEARARLSPEDPYYPYFLLAGAQSEREARHFEEGLALVAELEARPEPIWRCYALAHRGWLHLEAGRVDFARTPIEEAGRIADSLVAAGNLDRNTRRAVGTARFRLVHLDLARRRYASVVRRIDSWLEDPASLSQKNRAKLIFDLAETLEHLELTDPRRERRAEEVLRGVPDALAGLEDDDGLRVKARIALIPYALERGDVAAAAALLDGLEELPLDLDARTELAVARSEIALASKANREELERHRARLLSLLEERLPDGADDRLGRGPLHYRVDRAPLVALLRLGRALEGDGGAREALEWIARFQVEGALARRIGATAPDLETLRSTLTADGAGVLVLLTYMRRSHWIALDAEGVRAHDIAGVHELLRDRDAHWTALIAPNPDDLGASIEERERARTLSDGLFPAALRAQLSGWRSVTFVGLELLGPTAVEWLPVDDERNLREVVSIEHAPSLPFAVACARAAVEPIADAEIELVLVVADPPEGLRREWGVGAVPFGAADERAVTRAYGDHARVHRTLPEWREIEASPVLQFVAHGVRPEDGWRGTELLLEDGSTLGADEVDAVRSPSLVLLTSCASGEGPARAGDAGSADLAGAFLGSGARAVLVTYTDLRYRAAIELSAEFQLRLRRDGLAPRDALREALATLASRPGPPLPLRLGSVQLLGSAGRPVFLPREVEGDGFDLRLAAAGAGALLLATFLVARARRRR